MGEFKGTKGKWRIESRNSGLVKRIHVDDFGFAEVYFNQAMPDEEEFEANALLISKAPEMLELLIKCERTLRVVYHLDTTEIEKLIKESTELN